MPVKIWDGKKAAAWVGSNLPLLFSNVRPTTVSPNKPIDIFWFPPKSGIKLTGTR